MSIRHSPLLKEEALALASEIGMDNAARKLGISKWAIDTWLRQQKVALGIRKLPPRKLKYTLEQRRRCVALAEQLRFNGQAKNYDLAYEMAGKMIGVPGRIIYKLKRNGKLYTPFMPLPSTSSHPEV